ncbi:hydrophobin [Xylaria nigripes]|nr:hydrophobin [Xylaria nigripes]
MKTTLFAVVGLLATAVAAVPGYPGGGNGGGGGGGGGNGGNGGGGNGGGGNGGGNGGFNPCTALLDGTPQCCAVDVLGVADLNCANPSSLPSSPDDFRQICADVGKQAACCVLPILGQALLCQPPVGI